tara:strand:- start:435 stop:659 length:225 start_codon:yes stop_codon:yes gene_type:complete
MKPKVILKMEIPINGENVTVSDTCVVLEDKIKNIVEELNKDLTDSKIFGILEKWTIEIQGVKDATQLELDIKNH